MNARGGLPRLRAVGASAGPPKPLKVSPIDLEARAKIEAFARGEAPPADVIEVVDDAEVSEEVREEAADALIATENPKLVPKVVSLLYSNDEITRKLGNRLIKALTGKSFGYNATADEEKRSAAIQKILKHIQKYEKKYQ